MIERKCSCVRGSHRAPLEKYIVGENAIEQLPAVPHDYHRVDIVCDENTHRVLGEKAAALLRTAHL